MSAWIKVTAAIIIEARRVLITQRAAHDAMGGKWEFPGGKIESGETAQACLQRELQEELGIFADVHTLFAVNRHAYPHLKIELFAYRASIRSGELSLHTHQAARWVAFADLVDFDFSAADQPFVQKLIGMM